MTTSNNNKNLTELWEKGELEVDQYYYVKYADGSVEIQLYVGGFLMRTDNRVVEVLALVPTFEDWQELRDVLNTHKDYCCCQKNEVLLLENQRLKELLWSCQAYFNNQLNDNWAKSIIMDIETAIGGDKDECK